MTHEEQKRYLIRLTRAALRQLMIYRTFAEIAKKNAGSYADQIDSTLKDIQSEPSLVTQLGSDFEKFLETILGGPEGDADLALENFIANWFPNAKAN